MTAAMAQPGGASTSCEPALCASFGHEWREKTWTLSSFAADQAGFTEAAAIVEADIERQRLDEEEDDADVIDLTAARNRQSDWEWDDAA